MPPLTTPHARTPISSGKRFYVTVGDNIFESEGTDLTDPKLEAYFRLWMGSVTISTDTITSLTAKLKRQNDELAAIVAQAEPAPKP